MYRKAFDDWKQNTNQRQKLQWTYAVIAVVGLLVAGLLGLIDMELAQNLLQVVYVATGLFIANFIAWALITTFLEEESKLEAKADSAKSRKR